MSENLLSFSSEDEVNDIKGNDIDKEEKEFLVNVVETWKRENIRQTLHRKLKA